jgi:hypothetical protein
MGDIGSRDNIRPPIAGSEPARSSPVSLIGALVFAFGVPRVGLSDAIEGGSRAGPVEPQDIGITAIPFDDARSECLQRVGAEVPDSDISCETHGSPIKRRSLI